MIFYEWKYSSIYKHMKKCLMLLIFEKMQSPNEIPLYIL